MFRKIRIEKGIVILTLVYLLTFLVMLPLRNQTYQDDWAYALSVKNFLNTGVLRVSDWSSASLIFPIYWGSLFSRIFGANLISLHISTISIFFIGLLSFYLLLRKLGLDQTRSTFFSIILLSFPWVFDFSYTFLTDIPFVSLSIVTILLYTLALQKNKKIFFVLGSIFAGFSYLTRQIGIAFPISIFLVLAISDLSQKKINIMRYLLSLVPFALMAGAYSFWLKSDNNLTTTQYQLSKYFLNGVLPYLWPFDVKKVGGTYGYYLSFVQRIVLYFHLIIGFLLPSLFVFKINLKSIKNVLIKYKISILIISVFYLIFLALEIFLHYSRRSYILEVPTLVTRYSIVSILDFQKIWKFIVGISVVIWIPIVAIIFHKIIKSIFKPIEKKRFKLFIILSILGILFLGYYEFLLFQDLFRNTIPRQIYVDPFATATFYLNSINTPTGINIIQNNLVIQLVIATAIFTITVLVTSFKIKLNIKKPELAFILLSFLGIFSILVFYMYFYWHQYIISIVAFFIIALAIISKKWEFNKFRMFAVCTILLLFSVSLTKNRYEKSGIG